MEKFTPGFESLKKYQCPEWFQNAKFGIWSHWGPQSVPMAGDWYAREMYMEGTEKYRYHLRHYGHPSEFGYKDLCQLWKAEKFDPMELMGLYYKAGARYFVAQAMHHDHFFNYPSKFNRFNSMEVGPHKDICGMWKEAADAYGMPFGLTEHLGASFSWWAVNKGCDKYGPYAGVPYDGNDPEYRDFYYDNEDELEENGAIRRWYTHNKKFHQYWLDVVKEMIDRYEPDLLYSDGGLPFGSSNNSAEMDELYKTGLEAVSYFYNKSIEKYGENRAVYNQKDRRPEIHKIGVLDIERSQLPDIRPEPWQTDTCIGVWFYDARQEFKKPGHVIEMLIDIISKNGTLLLNILQRPDGTIDDETRYILEELASWFEVCSEAVYDTRPWRVSGEGDTRVLIQGFKEEKTEWNSSDYRFVQKDHTVYAYILKVPENRVAVLKSFTPEEEIKNVRLLGYGDVEFVQSYGVLTVKLPQELPTGYTNCLAVEMKQ